MLKALGNVALATAGFAAAMLTLAPPASASSFTWDVSDGVVSYTDSGNRLCARAFDGNRTVRVTINGRDYVDTDWGSPATCWTLSGLTENRSYVAYVNTRHGDTWVYRGSHQFYA